MSTNERKRKSEKMKMDVREYCLNNIYILILLEKENKLTLVCVCVYENKVHRFVSV